MTKRHVTRKVVVHCSATYPDMDIGFKEIDEWHKAKGWAGCGYHFIIRRDGCVEFGRPVGDVGAHVRGWNSSSVGICLVGGLSRTTGKGENNFTKQQFRSLRRLYDVLLLAYPDTAWCGHHDLDAGKECPCFSVHDWIKETVDAA